MYTKFFVELLYGNVDSYFPVRIHKCIVVLITTHPGFNRWKEDAVGCHGQSSERQTAIVGAVGKKAARQHLGDLARPDTGKILFLRLLILGTNSPDSW
jgi:hypothetical protein